MNSPLHAHFLHPPEARHLEILRSMLDPRIAIALGDAIPTSTNILIAGRPRQEHIAACPRLSALIIPFAGLPPETRKVMQAFPQIGVYNLHHNAPMTAEMAIVLLLAAARGIVPADRSFRRNDWTARYAENKSVILDGKTALILGYGAVGRRVGAICKAMGMRVMATRRRTTESQDGIAEIYPPEALPRLLPAANVLIICLPNTPETENLIGGHELSLLPKDAILVNVGRAAVVDQAALYNALFSGELHSAGLDVWYHYPQDEASRINTPPADYPFAELPNVVLSPHRAGGGGADEVEERRMRALADSLNAAARGQSIPGQIDLDTGY